MNKWILAVIAMSTFSMASIAYDVIIPCTTKNIYGMNIQCGEIGYQTIDTHVKGIRNNDELDVNASCDVILKESPMNNNAFYFLDALGEVKFVECLISEPAPISFAEANPPRSFFFGSNNTEINALQARAKKQHEEKLRKRMDVIKTYITNCQ